MLNETSPAIAATTSIRRSLVRALAGLALAVAIAASAIGPARAADPLGPARHHPDLAIASRAVVAQPMPDAILPQRLGVNGLAAAAVLHPRVVPAPTGQTWFEWVDNRRRAWPVRVTI